MANSAANAFQNKSWAQIGLGAVNGAISAGIGFGVGRLIGNSIYSNNDLSFADFYQNTLLGANKIISIAVAFRASWYTFIPTVSTGVLRGISKFIGNKGIDFL